MDSEYKPIPKEGDLRARNGSKPTPSGKRIWLWHFISHFLSLLWLAPAIFLLYLNITKFVIGNTLWCPSRHCNVLGGSVQEALRHDRDDHNVNGALLFVQKFVEVWFTAVATLLVYDLAMMFARREGGLPIGYLLVHLEFTDVMNLLNPIPWTSAFSKRNNVEQSSNDGNSPRVAKFTLFAVLITCLTIVANLMGPAGGVLVLPTVQWVDTDYEVQEQFQALLSADSPAGDATLAGCTSADLKNKTFSCTDFVYAPILENILSNVIASDRASTLPSVIANEANLRFIFDNGSFDQQNLLFLPNRKAINSFSNLLSDEAGFKPETYNDSIQAIAHRSGPLIGSFVGLGGGDFSTINVTADKQVRCLSKWFDVSSPDTDEYTKCVRLGQGWSSTNAVRSFAFSNDTARDEHPDDILVNIYFSDKATYFNKTTDFGSGMLACSKSSYSDCDWDAIFSKQLPYNFSRIANNSLVVETSRRKTRDSGLWTDSTSYPSFVDYQLGLSAHTDLDPLITTANATTPITNVTAPLVINPDWLLAAWSVNDGGFIDGTSPLGKMIASVFNEDDDVDVNSIVFGTQLFATAHALTLIPYSSINLTSPGRSRDENANDIRFYYWRSRRVWMFSVSGRTAVLGVVIICIGMVVVVMRTLLAIYEKLHRNYATRAYSPTEIIVSSLAHRPQGEFDHLEDESARAQVRFRVHDDGSFLQFDPQKTKTS